jgi:hypothetical protein
MAHAFMGMAAEARHDTVLAKAQYQDYLALAPRHAVERGWVAAQLARLGKR